MTNKRGRPATPVSDQQKADIARMMGLGETMRHISAEVGLNYDTAQRVSRLPEVVNLALVYRREVARQLLERLRAEIVSLREFVEKGSSILHKGEDSDG